MSQPLPQRRHARLEPRVYAELGAVCSVTIAVKNRARIFADGAVAAAAVSTVTEHAGMTDVPVYGYCVMPDHVHLVLGPSPTCDIVTFVGQFKNLAQRSAWQLGVVGAFWQVGFWDHFLRVDEAVEDALKYVLHNPVRARLVTRWQDYPFSGSCVLALVPD